MFKFVPIVTLALTCACSPSHTVSTQNGSVSVTERGKDESSIHVAGKDGATVDINTGKPITDYPSDAPLYQGKSMMDMKSAEKHSRVVTLQSPDSIQKIADFYKNELPKNGWKVESAITSPEMSVYVAKKDSRQLTITIGGDSGGQPSSISQTLADK
jgi:hypothetical protein